jgi:hypothetical protein
MHRAQFIIGLIIASALLAPSMFCLIPGAVLTPAEAECCRQMSSTCGDIQMDHSCCKPSKPSGEFGLIAHSKYQPPNIQSAIIENLLGFRPEVQVSHDGTALKQLALEHPPSDKSIDILRI